MSQEDNIKTEGIDLSLDEIIKKNNISAQNNFSKHQLTSPSKIMSDQGQGNWQEKKGMRGGRYFTQRGRSRGGSGNGNNSGNGGGSGRGNRININNRRMNSNRWRNGNNGENMQNQQQMSWKENNNNRFYSKDNYTPKIENPLDEDEQCRMNVKEGKMIISYKDTEIIIVHQTGDITLSSGKNRDEKLLKAMNNVLGMIDLKVTKSGDGPDAEWMIKEGYTLTRFYNGIEVSAKGEGLSRCQIIHLAFTHPNAEIATKATISSIKKAKADGTYTISKSDKTLFNPEHPDPETGEQSYAKKTYVLRFGYDTEAEQLKHKNDTYGQYSNYSYGNGYIHGGGMPPPHHHHHHYPPPPPHLPIPFNHRGRSMPQPSFRGRRTYFPPNFARPPYPPPSSSNTNTNQLSQSLNNTRQRQTHVLNQSTTYEENNIQQYPSDNEMDQSEYMNESSMEEGREIGIKKGSDSGSDADSNFESRYPQSSNLTTPSAYGKVDPVTRRKMSQGRLQPY